MTYDPQSPYGADPRYPQNPQSPQGNPYPPAPQSPQYPQGPQGPQYPPQSPQQYPSANPYPPTQAYPASNPYAQPGTSEPTVPIGAPQSGGANPYGGGGSYGASDPYSGSPYGADPYAAGPSSGWPGGPGSLPPGAPPKKPKTGMIVGLVAGAVVLVLVLGGLAVAATRLLDEDSTGDPPPADIADDPTAEPTSDDPFADTPAADFASGADGIVLPEPSAVGEFSEEQVADMLEQVRDSLIATRLDEGMLFEHDPEPFISTMAEDNQEGLQTAFDDGEFGYFATQIADGSELAVAEPRVEGTITFEASVDEGGINVIEVVTQFVWAYAFVLPNDNPDLDGVVVMRDRLVWQVADPAEVSDSSQGLWLWDGEGYASGIDCELFDQSLIAPQSELSAGSGEGPDDSEVYDPEASLDLPDTC